VPLIGLGVSFYPARNRDRASDVRRGDDRTNARYAMSAALDGIV
jgi:hypothetical protein